MRKERRKGEKAMAISKEDYAALARRYAPPSPLWKDCAAAFLCGGTICALSQLALALLQQAGADEETGRLLVMIGLIAGTAVCTALGVFDKLAKHAGAGTAVPITGFANAVVSPALESKSEGFVLGTAAQMFSIAGPVIVFGCGSAAVWGLVYFLWKKAGG
jgi:stage V sporulation protein AC